MGKRVEYLLRLNASTYDAVCRLAASTDESIAHWLRRVVSEEIRRKDIKAISPSSQAK